MFSTVLTSFTSFLKQTQSPAAIPSSSSSSSSTGPASSFAMSSTTSPGSSPVNTRTNCSPSSSHTVDTTSSTGLVSSPAPRSTSRPATSAANGSYSPTSSHTIHAIVGFDPESPEPLYFHDLRICTANNSFRGNLVTLNLPPVMQIAHDDIQLVVDPWRLNNPL